MATMHRHKIGTRSVVVVNYSLVTTSPIHSHGKNDRKKQRKKKRTKEGLVCQVSKVAYLILLDILGHPSSKGLMDAWSHVQVGDQSGNIRFMMQLISSTVFAGVRNQYSPRTCYREQVCHPACASLTATCQLSLWSSYIALRRRALATLAMSTT